jgi:threonylcarbamoyladenosine tRNA methylthiotransferase MtaB
VIAPGGGPAADTVVINSCAVTNEAVRRHIDPPAGARQPRRKSSSRRRAGSGDVRRCGGRSRLGNEEKRTRRTRALPAFAVNDEEKASPTSWRFGVAAHLLDGSKTGAAFVQVQTGCDHRCTFCIIPYGRGNSRSVPAGAVVEQVRRLTGNGYAEIVLTGVD